MTDPTAIRLAIEERRADFAVALADLHNQAARRAVQTTEAEIEAHRATLDLLAKAGADPGGATDACRFLGCSAADLLATVDRRIRRRRTTRRGVAGVAALAVAGGIGILTLGGDDVLTAGSVRRAFANVPGNPLAKGLVETAVLDAQLRRHDMPLVDYLVSARRPIAVGVSVGIPDDLDTLLSWVSGYLDDGYRRVKLKIQPGWDLAPVRAVREAFGPDLPLQVDANQAYTPADIPLLARLDAYGLVLIEQPFARHELLAHAKLAARHGTPVCLDESVLSLDDAMTAIRLSAADVINIKPSRVGGYLTARSIHDVCLANGVPVF